MKDILCNYDKLHKQTLSVHFCDSRLHHVAMKTILRVSISVLDFKNSRGPIAT